MRKSLIKMLVVMSIMAMTLSACGADATPTAVTESTATTAPAASSDATKAPETAATATSGTTSSTAPEQLPRNETLYIAGLQWQPPTNFNPLNGNPDWPGMGNHLETYETLFAYNQLSGNLDPLLAKELTTVDTATMKITLQDGTKWQDGQALTTDDVVYTYELAKSQSDINYNTLFDYITGITSTGDRTLEVKLNEKSLNPGIVKNFFTQIKILPKHVYQPLEAKGKLSQAVITDPVGSGPYKVLNFSPERVALVR